jgi:hypothetical protein
MVRGANAEKIKKRAKSVNAIKALHGSSSSCRTSLWAWAPPPSRSGPPLMVLKKQIKTTKIKNTKTHVYIFLKNFVNRKSKPWE